MPAADDHRLRPAPLLVATTMSVANLFLHKPISDVLDALYARIGRNRYELVGIAGIGGLSLLAALPAAKRLRSALAQTWLPLSLLGLAVLTVVSQRWLLVTNIELIHFPQFGLIAVLFLLAGVSPRTAWICGTLAGLLDETYQHLVLYAGVANTYFDINDILLNSVGAAWGVCLFGAAQLAAEGPKVDRTAVLRFGAVLATALLIAVILDPPDATLLRKAATRKLYRVLSTGEGLVGIAITWALVELASHPRRGRRG